MLELVVAQRRHDRSQAGRARRALAAAAHDVLVAGYFETVEQCYMQVSELPDLLFRRRFKAAEACEAAAQSRGGEARGKRARARLRQRARRDISTRISRGKGTKVRNLHLLPFGVQLAGLREGTAGRVARTHPDPESARAR